MITYKEQFDKLTAAYINGEVDPFDCKACFCGNLLNGNLFWAIGTNRAAVYHGGGIIDDGPSFSLSYAIRTINEESRNTYTMLEIAQLESKFLMVYRDYRGVGGNVKNAYIGEGQWTEEREKQNEEALFQAFVSTLDLLKEIHISKGEIIEEHPIFVKRELKLA